MGGGSVGLVPAVVALSISWAMVASVETRWEVRVCVYAVSFGRLLAGAGMLAAEVGVAGRGVGGALSAKAERGVDWREEERRSRAAFFEPFFEAVGAMVGVEVRRFERTEWLIGAD